MPTRLASILVLAAALHAQPAFEAATVKPAGPTGDRGTNINTTGDTITLHNATLKFAIQAAYNVPVERITGGPDWAGTRLFEIVGKSASPVAPPELLRMLRGLLASRFQLRVQSQMRDADAFALVPAKGGVKLKLSDPNDGSAPSLLGRPARGAIVGHKATMAQLAATLTVGAPLGRPVLDKSGLTGAYEFTLDGFAPLTAAPEDPRPSFFTALEEKVGLKLEPTKVPLEFLTIETASPPGEN